MADVLSTKKKIDANNSYISIRDIVDDHFDENGTFTERERRVYKVAPMN